MIEPGPVTPSNWQSDADRVFALQKPAYHVPSAQVRIERLRRLGRAIRAHEDELEDAAFKDLGRNKTETGFLELLPTYEELRFAIRNVKSWMRPKRVPAPIAIFGTRSRVELVPRGTALIISPWNYPILLAFSPLVAALAAGNRAILKPSEISSHVSAVTAKIIREAFHESEVAVLLGDHQVSTHLLRKPFDHIFFTGSTRVGKIVMEAAAKHLSSITLELGGKSPAIVLDSARIELAARKIAWGKFCNAGQTCVAPDYVLVPRALETRFNKELESAVREMYGEAPRDSQSFGRIVNAAHFNRLQSLIEGSVGQGARIVTGGAVDPAQKYIAPTILSGVTGGMPVMDDEIFGPVLPVLAYDALDGAIAQVKARPNPLALYVFGEDRARVDHVLKSVNAGGICINETVVHLGNNHLPFG
ncbi:MAG TPA: aldehyde dehydrogenase family protein, partial [Bdellovibrionales bacterium]|nr:aldehyde dehydrogenase family protein [Bdellovibrionales bacterium]